MEELILLELKKLLKKPKREINKEINRAGEDAAREVGLSGLPRENVTTSWGA